MKTKQKFDGYAIQYDEWFMKNENLFTSELNMNVRQRLLLSTLII